ncbi:uncharacterized protein LOC111088998, partial [Limulus polyphemus]|uniref:Uncharacterized protein LOC111088998 n=1 Tax=Limulus polyphemus TaxID=6850 RepID=A0ABM1TK43_LIMPO
VKRVNYAPTVRKLPSLQNLPTLSLDNPDPGRPSVEYTDPVFEDFNKNSLGMIVIYAQTSEFGQWEIRTPKSEKWDPLLTGKSFIPNTYKMGFISGEKFCLLHNLRMKSYKPVLLNATDKLRFHSPANLPWWNTTQAKQNTLLIFSAWDMSDSLIPHDWPCSLHSSVSADLFLFSLEYRDCSGQNVVDKPLTVDACGVCNGDNMSCQNLVCNGGNSCDVCGTNVSGISNQRDCAGSCEQENALLTFGDHEVCILFNIVLQQLENIVHLLNIVIFEASELRVYDCTSIRFHSYAIIPTSSRTVHINIRSLEELNYTMLNCEVFDKENNSYTENISVKELWSHQRGSYSRIFFYKSKLTVKYHLLDYMFFLVYCEMNINLTTGIHRVTDQQLFVWDTEMFVVTNITPSTININENVKVTVEMLNKTTSGLWCFFGTVQKMTIVSKAIILGPYSVQCDLPSISTHNVYQLMIIPESKIVNNSTRISMFVPNKQAHIKTNIPVSLALEAGITEELNEIKITFDINLYFNYNPHHYHERGEEKLKLLTNSESSCRMFGNFIFISLPSAFNYTSNMKIEFVESHFEYAPKGVVHVKLPHQTVKPILHVEGPEKVCSGMLQIHISEVVGGGVFGLNYTWSITPDLKVNLATIFDFLENTTSLLEIPVEKLEPGVTYIFSVYGENIMGVKSDTYFHSVVRINDQKLTVTIAGPDEVSIWAENTLVAEVAWCSNVSHQIYSLTYYWSVNSSDFHLPQEWGPVLRISKYMKGQRTYKFTVTVIDVISLEVLSQATHIVRTKEIPLVVSTGVSSLVVLYNQSFCLNGSRSYDPSKEQEPMYYRWMCSLSNGLACYITQKEGSMLRLEQTLGDIFSSVLCIDGGVLLPEE